MAKRWDLASKQEYICWDSQKDFFNSEEYSKKKRVYWKTILKELPFSINKDDKVLEVGCGPVGIKLSSKKGVFYGIDPLLDYFHKNFKMPKYDRCISKKIEDYKTNTKFDVIFAMEVLDHVDNLKETSEKIESLLKKGGYLVVEMRCCNYNFVKYYYKLFGRFIDSPHPHHPKISDIISLFQQLKLIELKTNRRFELLNESKPTNNKSKNLSIPLFLLTFPLSLIKKIKKIEQDSTRNRKSLFTFNIFVFKKHGN